MPAPWPCRGRRGGPAPGRPSAAKGRRFFQHGVASGDPLPDAVLIWTRVTPNHRSKPGLRQGQAGQGPLGGRQGPHVPPASSAGARSRPAPSRDHTVKVDVTGLEPETWYFYRFHFNAGTSRVGRTRTAPAANATPDHLRFGVVSCANWQAGYFSAYRGLAKRKDLHAVLHLGDYLYEYGPGGYGYGMGDVDIRSHVPGARDGLAARLPAAARAVQDRQGPPGPARGVPLDHHLGRPRGHQRPVRHRRREPPAGDRGRLQGPPGAGAPRVRRVDAGPDGRHRPAARRRPALPPAAVRQAGRDQHARPAHLPQQAGRDRCPTPVPAAEAEVERPVAHHHRQAADAVAQGRRSTGSARSGR